MRTFRFVWILAAAAGAATSAGQTPTAPQTLAASVDADITRVEKQLADAAAAMPEAKFDFSPEGLNIPGADYKGVRTFAQQVKHVAASNYFLWATVTGDPIPDNLRGGNGPENVKTKAEILKLLKDSFVLGHKAAAMLTAQNMLQPVGRGDATRLHFVTFAVAHAYDHYGQRVEYLRMNGIVPPASAGK